MSKVLSWLKSSFAVNSVKKDEVNFPCPRCGHSSFYFNYKKEIGFCHRASCHSKISLDDLVGIKGYGPDSFYTYISIPEEKKVEIPVVTLPGKRIIDDYGVINDEWALRALEAYRSNLFSHRVKRYKFTSTQDFIYIPIYENEKLVQYVGRKINRNLSVKEAFKVPHKQRYKFFTGAPISNYIFDWDYHKHTQFLTLIENTFSAISLSDCSTSITSNFGSHLSETQIEKIGHSNVKNIVFLWDKDALKNAYDCALTLRKKYGIICSILTFKDANQPDEIDYNVLSRNINLSIVKNNYVKDITPRIDII